MDERTLLPRLGPCPGHFRRTGVVLLFSAWLALLPTSAAPWARIAGDPEFTDVCATVSYHWLIHTFGLLGATHARILGYPLYHDRTILNGFPLDALISEPFLALFGWPLGYSLYVLGVVWALGLASAWLAGRWWRSSLAAVVAGVVIQFSGVFTFELSQGRTSQVMGAVFFPLAFGLFARSLVAQRPRDAGIAGVLVGLSSLVYWYNGWFCALAFAVLAALAWREGLPWLRLSAIAAGGALVVVGLPLVYTLAGLREQTGMGADLELVVFRRGHEIILAELLQGLALKRALVQGGAQSLRPLLSGLCLLALAHARLRRLAAPVGWIALGVFCSLGAWVELSSTARMPGAFTLLTELPILRRLWWPQRHLFLVAPAVALLAGGGALHLWRRLGQRVWVGPLLFLLIPAEAFLVLPQLPLPVTPGGPSSRALQLAEREGPTLILPASSGILQADARILLDQVYHHRPLVNWTMHPSDSNAPGRYRDMARKGQVGYLFQCEVLPSLDLAEQKWMSGWTLSQIGVQEVYLDSAVVLALGAKGAAYRACVERLLGPPYRQGPPYDIYLSPEEEGLEPPPSE